MGGCIDIVFYDITTLYFEAADENDLRRTGYSKDGKFDCPQVLLGLLVTREGLPISYEIFEGDLSEKKTFIPLFKRAQQKLGFPSPVVVADAGLLSRKNIKALVGDGYEYILEARLKNENAAVKKRILALDLQEGQVASIKTDDGLRIVVSFTEKHRNKDAFNRPRGLQRIPHEQDRPANTPHVPSSAEPDRRSQMHMHLLLCLWPPVGNGTPIQSSQLYHHYRPRQ